MQIMTKLMTKQENILEMVRLNVPPSYTCHTLSPKLSVPSTNLFDIKLLSNTFSHSFST